MRKGLAALLFMVGLVGASQEVISFPLSEDLVSTDGSSTLTALANDASETGFFGTLNTSTTCTVPSTTAYFFNDNAGLEFFNDNFIDQAYSLEMTFKLDELLIRSTRSSDWVNLISFNQTTSDLGIYILIRTEGSGELQFWNSSTSTESVTGVIFNETDLFHLVLTRSAGGLFSIYVNGVVARSSFADVDDAYLPNDTDDDIYFFRDFPIEAFVTDALDDEASPGWVRTLNIANYEWTASEVTDRFDVICDRLIIPEFNTNGVCLSEQTSFELTTDASSADSIVWNFGDGSRQSGVGLDNVSHTYAASGSYPVEVTTYFFGTGNTATETITIAEAPVVDLGPDQTLAAGETVVLSAVNTASSYLWQDGSTSPTFTVTESGTYNVTVTNASGCSSFDEVTIIIGPVGVIPEFSTNGICLSEQTSFELITDVSSADSIAWDFGDGSSQSGVGLDNVSHTYAVSGSFLVEVTAYFSGMGNTYTETITIAEASVVDLGPDRSFPVGDSVILDATSSQSTYLWQDGSTDSVFVVTTPGTYNVTVTNASGCVSSDAITLTYESAEIPNAFTPNGDGENDVWIISTIDSYPNHLLRLFDRQGNLVREWTNYQNDWDGSINGIQRGRATYFYILLNDNQTIARGSVSVIR